MFDKDANIAVTLIDIITFIMLFPGIILGIAIMLNTNQTGIDFIDKAQVIFGLVVIFITIVVSTLFFSIGCIIKLLDRISYTNETVVYELDKIHDKKKRPQSQPESS